MNKHNYCLQAGYSIYFFTVFLCKPAVIYGQKRVRYVSFVISTGVQEAKRKVASTFDQHGILKISINEAMEQDINRYQLPEKMLGFQCAIKNVGILQQSVAISMML